MIIECPCKKKKFNIDINLIPDEGRNLQCGFCDRIWYYKKQDPIQDSLQINEETSIGKDEDTNIIDDDKSNYSAIKHSAEENNKEIPELSDIQKAENKTEVAKKNQSSKFFSYLIVFLISLVALVVLIDTLKTPLINVFPGLEQILFNLYETLKDIKLFIIDLS